MKIYDAARLILTKTLSDRQIAKKLKLSKTTVGRYRRLLREKKHSWEHLSALDPEHLRRELLRSNPGRRRKRAPNFHLVKTALEHPGVTLQLLCDDYRRTAPRDVLSYSQYAALFRKFCQGLPPDARPSKFIASRCRKNVRNSARLGRSRVVRQSSFNSRCIPPPCFDASLPQPHTEVNPWAN